MKYRLLENADGSRYFIEYFDSRSNQWFSDWNYTNKELAQAHLDRISTNAVRKIIKEIEINDDIDYQ